MKTFLLFACLIAGASALDNLVALAESLGAKTLVKLAGEAGLADTLSNGGKIYMFVFYSELM